MKKKQMRWFTSLIIIAIIIFSIFMIVNGKFPETSEEIAKCIGNNSVLYTQLGCHACERQKDMFGDNYVYLTIVDCFYEREKCEGIKGTPSWKINGEVYLGVQSIEKLQELTGC